MAHYRITFTGTLPGETFAFGIHAEGSAGDSAGAQTAASTAMNTFWTDATNGIEGLFNAEVEIVGSHAAELDPLTGKQIDAAEGVLALVGTNANAMLPHEVACAVTIRGAAPTRKNRGRFYLPPLAVTELLHGRFTAAATGRIVDGAAAFINSMQAAGFTPEVYHPDHTGTPVTIVGVGDVPDSQRRRRNKLVEVRTETGV